MPTKAERKAERAAKLKKGEAARREKRAQKQKKTKEEEKKKALDINTYIELDKSVKEKAETLKAFVQKTLDEGLTLKIPRNDGRFLEVVQEVRATTVYHIVDTFKIRSRPAYFTGRDSAVVNKNLKTLVLAYLREYTKLETFKSKVQEAIFPHHRALNELSYFQTKLLQWEKEKKETSEDTPPPEEMLNYLKEAQELVTRTQPEYEKMLPLYQKVTFFRDFLIVHTGDEKRATSAVQLSDFI